MDFDRWLQRFVSRIEKFLFRGTLLFIVFLFVVQALMTQNTIRQLFSTTDQFEGRPLIEEVQEAFGRSIIEENRYAVLIEAVYPPGNAQTLIILQNGKVSGELTDEPLRLAVNPGDMLEVFGSVAGGTPAVVRVKKVEGSLSQPLPGYEIATFGERELLAWIIP